MNKKACLKIRVLSSQYFIYLVFLDHDHGHHRGDPVVPVQVLFNTTSKEISQDVCNTNTYNGVH